MPNPALDVLDDVSTLSEVITTTEVAHMLGISRQAVLQRVRNGSLQPVFKSPARTGGYLFSAPDVACLIGAVGR